MRKRRETSDGRREFRTRISQGIKLTVCCIGAVAIHACSNGSTTQAADSTTTDTTATSQTQNNVALQSLSVTPPNSPVPKQAADSIWEGDYVEKYPNGVIKKRGYVKGGLASGDWLTFYDDGKPYSMGTYHAGYRTGYGVSWYHNGEKSSEGYYNEGKMVGKWKYWSEQDHQLLVKDYGGVMPDTTGMHKVLPK